MQDYPTVPKFVNGKPVTLDWLNRPAPVVYDDEYGILVWVEEHRHLPEVEFMHHVADSLQAGEIEPLVTLDELDRMEDAWENRFDSISAHWGHD